MVADPFTAKTDKVLLRPDREGKTNHIFHWEVGDKDGTAQALDVEREGIKQRIWFQRCHPAPLEPCGCVASSTRWDACSSTSRRRRRTSIAPRWPS